MPLLEGKVAIVTGAGGGIGRATVDRLVELGAFVVATDLDSSAGEETASLSRDPSRVTFIPGDVTEVADMSRVVDTAVSNYGRLDIAHNNAGVESFGPMLADVSPADFDLVVRVNLTGVFTGMRAQIPAMVSGGGGSIINTSSILGNVGLAGQSAYVASKHGVVGLTRSAALEYSAKGVRVNAVLPGVIRTPMVDALERENPGFLEMVVAQHPIGRLGDPSDVANVVAWLGSDMAAFVTGAAIPVDGGYGAQ